jgi:23S rRNA (cytosine1962-C5)-methyltransferase
VRDRLSQAIAYREALGIDATAYRLVHAEGDRLPSLIVDRYGDVLVVQALSQGSDRMLADIVSDLESLLRPAGILARHDARSRLLEGLEQKVEVLRGEVPERIVVRDRAVHFEVDLRAGQKTGLFLDQRENRWAAARWAHGRALDCFSYDGGFALQIAARCDEVIAVDISAEAVARIETNARRAGVANVRGREGNVFDLLRDFERAGERFDTIVLDPPAFAKSRAALPKALGGYKEINLRALKLLRSGGILVTCSCSFHVSEGHLLDVVHAAAADARVEVVLLEKRLQSSDHPVLLGVPESSYLKCLIARKL